MKKNLLAIALIILISRLGLGSIPCINLENRHDGFGSILLLSGPVKTDSGRFLQSRHPPLKFPHMADVNDDARYNSTEDGDTYTDVNGNGKILSGLA